ncbi:squalene--hopene cyclase [Streptomyces acidiscabies]|uniref:Squalene--hopene cyclase n=1 Tax=Streptomyces acidiscabies TaxID=42234 RepID=A0AAP6BAB7_9ACTN|nr:squalene--hopene cyclase [Streptomyces acidiscabies]MDX2961080.1 squalene--hopene cyclase [Streptomyces acidiscabies]MDX3020223.1 squalene--hopene cyclase [Streptomyces acidiscabies]MDX3791787.1 squalene--hopene cyclase [Streptomyces acidiscabies]GAQ56089.1 squalene--hopene cyclase [Streptomyces acidiscabies]GAV44417.1 squalene--hopene cyclase [Streptomyces acidiscabies]
MTATTDGSTGAALPHRAASASETDITIPVAAGVQEAAERAMRRATDHLLAHQDAQGWWKGDLETNVTMDAEDLLLRQFLGIRDERTTQASALFVRGEQREDGTWATFYGGPADLSATIEAYVALRLAGDDPGAPHMAKASAWIRAQGGLASARVFTRIWLALFGWWKWEDLPELPPELIYFPRWFPLSIYNFGCWARQTIVPLTVVSAKRPVRPAPFPLDELHTDPSVPNPPKPLAPLASWDGLFQRLDKVVRGYRPFAVRRLRRSALNSAARWIVERQENDGCWGGIQPPAVYSVIALHLLGYDLEHPVMRAGLESLDRYAVWREDGARMIEACQSPVWDTCLATIALADAGVPADHPQLVKAADWMLGEQIVRPGDWSVSRPQLPPGGWAFEFHNDNYPDIDDTAEVVLALRRVRHHDPQRVEKAIARGVRWNLGMQSRDGGWGAFDVDNTSPFPNRLPFCDFGEVIDPPSADVTAHVVEMLAVEGLSHDPRTRRGIAWLLAEQEPDGSWFGRWGVNYVYGTGSVVPALVAAGLPAQHPAIRRAVTWLEHVQNEDGGWGEDLRSYQESTKWAGSGDSTASQTGWALMALLSAGERDSRAVERGIAWLAETQREDGSWDEPYFTGTGFPWDFSINYHLYRQVFPLTALGRYVNGEPVFARTPDTAQRGAGSGGRPSTGAGRGGTTVSADSRGSREAPSAGSPEVKAS